MFQWDEKKAASNLQKHRVSFGEAVTAFADSQGLDGADVVHSGQEKRRFRIGKSVFGNILTIAYTVRKFENDQTKVRIISARRASRKERREYQKGFGKD
jgi:uncharacterized DUF497 family protein